VATRAPARRSLCALRLRWCSSVRAVAATALRAAIPVAAVRAGLQAAVAAATRRVGAAGEAATGNSCVPGKRQFLPMGPVLIQRGPGPFFGCVY
jgi:hypothetical protein